MRIDLHAFETLYHDDIDHDPWGFSSSPYELRKYDLTVASLPRRRYERCFEPGCAVGALTQRLAVIAEEVVAIDASPTAIARASERLHLLGNVSLGEGSIPEDWPDGTFDLIVLSELGYYWDLVGLTPIVKRVNESLRPSGHLVGVHWLGQSVDHLLDGLEVHAIVSSSLGRPMIHHIESDFVLDVWERRT